MQTLLIEKLALTFVGDAWALAAGAAELATGFVTAPIERVAHACDVTGAYARQCAERKARRQRRLREATQAWRRRRERLLDQLNPFRALVRLT